MANDLILLTGATGHLGFVVLRIALAHNYTVRAAVRSAAKAQLVRDGLARAGQPYSPSQLSFIEVPDILAPAAYDEAVQGAKFVIHVASPISSSVGEGDDLDALIVRPAIEGIMNMLEAVRRAGQGVDRVVITSSVVAITPLSFFVNGGSDVAVRPGDRIPQPAGPFTAAFPAYSASKVGALNRAEEWLQAHRPGFDVVHVHPSYIEGRNELSTSTAEMLQGGTNRHILNVALGNKAAAPILMATNHVEDTALVHVLALDKTRVAVDPEQKSRSFLASYDGGAVPQWNDVRGIVEKHFNAEVDNGVLSLKGDTPTFHVPYDVSDTEKVFGLKFKAFAEQARSVVGHYVEVAKRERNA